MAWTGVDLPALTAGRVLIADPSDDLSSSLAVVLGLNGFEARTAGTCAAAVAAAADFQPHVVVSALGLPDGDGCRLVRELRAAADPPPGVVVVTGHTDPGKRTAALRAGADAYLLKPADPAEVVGWVRRLRGPAAG